MNIQRHLSDYVKGWRLQSGTPVIIRPIHPQDQKRLVAFHQTLSERSVYLRYAGTLPLSQRIKRAPLSRLCSIEYGREMALVAEKDGTELLATEIIAVGALNLLPGTRDGEYSMLVTDRYQHQGLGTEMSRRLIDVALDWNLERIVAEVLPQNWAMLRALKTLDFSFYAESGSIRAIKVVSELGEFRRIALSSPGRER